MLKYYPYPAYDGKHKYFIITNDNKKVYFGASGYKDYIIYYKEQGKEIADKKKTAYIARHSKMNENWTRSGIDTSGFYAYHLLWAEPTLEASYNKLKKKLINWRVI